MKRFVMLRKSQLAIYRPSAGNYQHDVL